MFIVSVYVTCPESNLGDFRRLYYMCHQNYNLVFISNIGFGGVKYVLESY